MSSYDDILQNRGGDASGTLQWPTAVVSPTVASPVLVDITTVTVSEGPTSSATSSPTPAPSSGSTVPVAAIAGGLAGGVVLALAAVIGWIWWGKSIKKTQREKDREIRDILAVRANTRRNASSFSMPRSSNYLPSFTAAPSRRKVKFLSSDARGDSSSSKDVSFGSPVQTPRDLPISPSSSRTALEPGTETLNLLPTHPSPTARPQSPPRSDSSTSGPRPPLFTRQSSTPSVSSPLARFVLHKPSVTSSMSIYSTQSAEEHQRRVPPNFILAALGPSGVTESPAEDPPPSSFRNPFGNSLSVVMEPEHSRLSQISTDNAGIPPAYDPDTPIGVAYGGEGDV